MPIKFQTYQKVTVVDIPSRLVYANAKQIKEAIFSLIDNNANRITLNLKNTDFIDSSGLAVLVATLKRVLKHHGKVALLSPTKNARLLIELTRLHQIFEIYEDREQVVADLNKAV